MNFSFNLSTSVKGLKYGNAKKMVFALTRFLEMQGDLLKIECQQFVMAHITMKNYMKILRIETSFALQR